MDAALREATRFVFAERDPVGIIATGSIIRGQGHSSSDLDICVVDEAPFRRRVQRFFRDVPAEIFINPPHAVRGYFVEELRAEAREWWERPTLLSEADATRARYAIATQLEDGADVAPADGRTATMLLNQAVASMLEFICLTRGGRVPRSKELLAVAEDHDSEVGRLATAFFSTTSTIERLHAAEALADRTIGARGFFPWDSGPNSAPPPTDSESVQGSTGQIAPGGFQPGEMR